MYKIQKGFTLTYAIIAVNLAVYAYTSFLSGNIIETSDSVLLRYGQYNRAVMEGWYWQLFTAMFVHVNIVHLFGNMFFFFIFGLRAEEFFDAEEYLLVYLLSGFAGNLLTLVFGPGMLSAGASGAIFGMFGAVTIYVRRSVGQSLMGALVYAFFLLVLSSGVNVNVMAHLGGLGVGLAIGYLLAEKRGQRVPHQFSYRYSTYG